MLLLNCLLFLILFVSLIYINIGHEINFNASNPHTVNIRVHFPKILLRFSLIHDWTNHTTAYEICKQTTRALFSGYFCIAIFSYK